MDNKEKQLSEQESLKLITEMIGKVKSSYHETGISLLLWGSTIFIASFVTFLKVQFDFSLPFDIWLIALFAIIPQIIISIRESKTKKFSSHEDRALGMVWLTFGITLFGFIAYQNLIPLNSEKIFESEGWQLMRHSIDGSKPDEPQRFFAPNFSAIFLLVYALPTLITGVVKKCTPMIVGAIITYGLFFATFFVGFKFDMLLTSLTALVCWFIPGVILRVQYLKQKRANV